MKCPNCKSELRKIKVEIEDAKTKVVSHQCPNCDYFSFEPKTILKIIEEINQ